MIPLFHRSGGNGRQKKTGNEKGKEETDAKTEKEGGERDGRTAAI
jgi:hypothetical protein